MATMLPPYIAADVKSQAEKRIFELLRDDPDTHDWVVLHSLGLSHHAHKRYGEVDFVVLVPGGAVVCLEVKGGRISCHDGIWETLDRHNDIQRLKESPFAQAQSGMFALRKIVEEKAENGKHLAGLAYGYGVLFPNTDWTYSGTEYESWQVFHRGFVGPISAFIKGIVRNNADAKAGYPRPTKEDVARLRQFMRPDFEAPISPLGQVEEAESTLMRLTEEQYEVLDNLEGNPRLVIEGAAGTGKTLLAIEAARRAAASGSKVLLLCYNRLLGRWIEHRIESFSPEALPNRELITAGNFHRVLERDLIVPSSQATAFADARTEAIEHKQENRFFREDYAVFALDALAEGIVEPFDLLIVDEGQDLIYDESLAVLDNLVRGGLAGGRWMLFADFNRQAIYAGGMTAEQMRTELQQRAHYTQFSLKRNCRNTRRIGRETALLSGFERLPFALHACDGDSVDYRFYDSDKKQRKVIGDLVSAMLNDGLRPEDIVLLSPVRRERSCLQELPEEMEKRGLKLAVLDDVNLLQPPANTILFSTLHSFKGLERRAVVVTGVERLNDEAFRASLYVAMSRPTTRLYVLLSEAVRADYGVVVQLRQQWQSSGHA